jgi:hypothetical protein
LVTYPIEKRFFQNEPLNLLQSVSQLMNVITDE